MAHRNNGRAQVGTRVRAKASGRAGAIEDVYERGGRTLYDVEFDRSPEEPWGRPVRALTVVGIGADAFDDAFDVIP
jgi:hypothetical protein